MTNDHADGRTFSNSFNIQQKSTIVGTIAEVGASGLQPGKVIIEVAADGPFREAANVAAVLIVTDTTCPRARQLWPAGRVWTVNPSFPSTLTAPVFPPSKSPEARRWPVANS